MLSTLKSSLSLRNAVITVSRVLSSEVTKAKSAEVLAKESGLPIERTSLSRGLALNRFEKDYMIFPEFTDTEDVVAIQQFASKLREELNVALHEQKQMKTDGMSEHVLAVLLKNGVFNNFVPKAYDGVGMSTKELLVVNEALGTDLSTFSFVNQSYIAVRLLQLFGTEQQKEKYLQKLGSFQLRPALCYRDLTNGDTTEVLSFSGQGSKLNGWKADVINGDSADLYFVIAHERSDKTTNETSTSCYIIDRADVDDGQITVFEKQETHGLRGITLSKMHFSNIPVSQDCILGDYAGGQGVVDEIMSFGNFYLGSAVVGFLKKLLAELARMSSTTIQGNHRLSDNVAVRRSMSETAINAFVLESIVYYLGGMIDENLVLSTDIENAIMQLLINRVLREAFVTITQVAGSASTDQSFPYEQMTRDMNTLLSLNLNDVSLTKTISLSMIVSWVETTAFESRFMKANTLKRLFALERKENAWKNPKLQHFIAEHVHPSLEPGCRKLENTMTRLNMVLERIVEDAGSRIKEEPATLESLAHILENNLAMIATLARASRSYCIGLRNADIELAWAISFCHEAARQSESKMEFIMEHYGLIKKNPTLVNVGAAVVDFGGYPLESPIERNW